MRRILSSGRLSSAPGSERLKHKLSSVSGLQLFSSNASGDEFLAAIQALQDERVIHRTSRVTRNFSNAPSTVPANEGLGPAQNDSVTISVKKKTIFDEPLDEADCRAGARSSVPADDPVAVEIGAKREDVISQGEESQSTSDLGVVIHPESTNELREADLKEVSTIEPQLEDTSETLSVDLTDGEDLQTSFESLKPESTRNVDSCLVDLSSNDIQSHANVPNNSSQAMKKEPGGSAPAAADAFLPHGSTDQRDAHEKIDISDPPDTNVWEETGLRLPPLRNSSVSYFPSGGSDSRRFPEQKFESFSCDTDSAIVAKTPGSSKGETGLQNSVDGFGSLSALEFVAVVKIQAYYRGWLQRNYFLRLRASTVRMQAMVRGKQQAHKHQTFLNALIVLQKSWRMFQCIRFLKQLKSEREIRSKEKAAVVVQKHWRAFGSRCLVVSLKEQQIALVHQRHVQASTVLQKQWRGRHDRLLANHLRRERTLMEQRTVNDAALVLQSHWRAFHFRQLKMKENERLKYERDCGAIVLQKHWRALQSRRFVNGLKLQQAEEAQRRRICAAIVLQKYWRGLQSKRLARCLKIKTIESERQIRNCRAVVMQKYWRALQSRRLANSLKMKSVEMMQRKISAAVVLQKHWRAIQSKRLTKSLKLALAQGEQARNDSAVILQKHWRALQSRRLANLLKFKAAEKMRRETSAAVVLQKHWRALQSRYLANLLKLKAAEKMERETSAAVVLQKHWRALQSKRLTASLKLALARRTYGAILLQKHWRSLQSRRLANSLKLVSAETMRRASAAVVLQKQWRALQSRRLTGLLKFEMHERENTRKCAAIVLQKHWRALQSRRLARSFKLQAAERIQRRTSAAVVLQKNWRAFQCKRLTKLAIAEREHTRHRGAMALQKHWRALQGRRLASSMQLESAERMQRRISAALVLQKHWRALQSRRLASSLKLKSAERMQKRSSAAVVLQKHWRALQSKRLTASLKLAMAEREYTRNRGAITLQRHWRVLQSRHLANSLKLKSAERMQRRISAAVAFQRHWRALQSRRLANSLRLKSAARMQRREGAAVVVQKHWRALQSKRLGDAVKLELVEAEQARFCGAVVLQKHWRAVQGRCLAKSLKSKSEDESIVRRDGQDRVMYHAFASHAENPDHFKGDSDTQTGQVQEDWNYISVDNLDECLDTCLSTLRPLPPKPSSQALDDCIPLLRSSREVSHLGVSQGHSDGNTKEKEGNSDSEALSCNLENIQQVPEPLKDTNRLRLTGDLTRAHSGQELSSTHRSCSADSLDQHAQAIYQVNPKPDINSERLDMNQNEGRLKQFAQVFLLQRYIAMQQQRAQAAPPFPVPLESRSEASSSTLWTEGGGSSTSGQEDIIPELNAPVSTTANDGAVQGLIHSDANPVQAMPVEQHSAFEPPEADDPSSLQKLPIRRQASPVCVGQPTERSPPDVVLDMVVLLQCLGEHGISEDISEEDRQIGPSSTCLDIEEGLPLMGRDWGSIKDQSSAADGVGYVSGFRRVSIPDVNAMLLVIVAMVVYTKAICRGVLFRSKQSPRPI